MDILGSLFTDDVATKGSYKRTGGAAGSGVDFDFDSILNTAGGDGEGDEGDEAFISLQQAASFRKAANLKGTSLKKGGGFQAMGMLDITRSILARNSALTVTFILGLSSNLLRAITRKGFSVPTPIQRKAIPLIMDRKDVVGMARTGSGKTAAFVIPMIERLRAHSARVGSRALVLSPSRELALQTLKVVKEFGKGTDLKTVLLVGGDSLEDQFTSMTTNPDIVIATPGRFLHLKVEMALDLSSIKYVVFDEADRLFEMGFAAQLTEIIHALPPSRQTLLFSATLPATLVEFARAGLQEPSLVRLDAETKVSPDLESAFFAVKGGEKEGALLHVLHDVIKMPLGPPQGAEGEGETPTTSGSNNKKKRKRDADSQSGAKPSGHSTIVFAATKHHVEFLANLLEHAGFSVSYVYGSLDQTARKTQVDNFRRGRTNILVVTDVAARGIDIPVLANVVNYDFPPQPKVFVHRVGRTARAGRRGWSYSLVRDADAPYLLDLQLFLGRKLVLGRDNAVGAAGAAKPPSFAEDVVVGALRRDDVESNVEWVSKVLGEVEDLNALRRVAGKAEKLYLRTRNSASTQSAKRSREIVASRGWSQLHPIFGQEAAGVEEARAAMLAKISGFKPQETIFEIRPKGKASQNEAAEVIRNIRAKIAPRKKSKAEDENQEADEAGGDAPSDSEDDKEGIDVGLDVEALEGYESVEEEEEGLNNGDDNNGDGDDDDEVEVSISKSTTSKKGDASWKDSEVYMSYTPRTLNAAEERGYGVHSGATNPSFVEAARDATMDLADDEGAKAFGAPTRARMRWDKKQNKYVASANDEDGSRGAKMVTGESGVKIAASFQSGRFDKWRRANRLGQLPRVGETERRGLARNLGAPHQAENGYRYKHKMEKAPKEADKFRDDYYVRKKRVAEAKEKRIGKFKDGEGSSRELKGVDAIRKDRKIKELKKAKNARPSGKGKVRKK